MKKELILTKEEEMLILNRRKRGASKEVINTVKEGWDKLPTIEQFIGNINDQKVSITEESLSYRELGQFYRGDCNSWIYLLRQVYKLAEYKEIQIQFIYSFIKINIDLLSINNKIIYSYSRVDSIEGYDNTSFSFFIPEDYNLNLSSLLKLLINNFQEHCKEQTKNNKEHIDHYKQQIKDLEARIKNRKKLEIKYSNLIKSLKKSN